VVLCNDTKVTVNEDNIETISTETALISFAYDNGFSKDLLEKSYLRKDEIPYYQLLL
jgi:magnesium-transporting ATPase (P-type)